MLAVVAAAVAVLGPISFVLLRAVYVPFYEPFGLTPADVGLDSTRVLATSLSAFALGLAAWTIAWFLVAAVPAVALAAIAPTPDPAIPRRGEDLSIAAVGAAVVLGVGIGAVSTVTATNVVSGNDEKIAWLVLASVPAALVLGSRNSPRATTARRALKKPIAKGYVIAVAALFAVANAWSTVVSDAADLGPELAKQVQAGAAVSKPTLDLPPDFQRLQALDIQADVANVHWLVRRPSSVGANDCLMYLGSAAGVALLWNVPNEVLVRAPQSTVVISTSGLTACRPGTT